MTSYGSGFDSSESNKENLPFPHLITSQHHKDTIVLPPLPEKGVSESDIDVVTVHETIASPSFSQNSNASSAAMSTVASPSEIRRRDSSDEQDAESEDGETTSRKEKSLGLLCQRFLIAMNEETRCSMTKEVHLETVARKMNVEKRRIYDIVNVMEALDAMSKTNKSFYRWHGLDQLPRLMLDLQREAVVELLPERVMRVEQAMCSFTELSAGRSHSSTPRDVVGSMMEDSPSMGLPSDTTTAEARRSRVDGRDRQGRNSLAQLCRRFLMVLLSNPKNTRRVSLDVASTVLIKDPETEGFEPPSRSRCRRLYDIANVLVALGLIKKVHYLFGTKKIPLFVYCGPEPDESAKYDANACLEKMLTNSSSAPQTPQMKATTAAMVQSLSLGKRSQSDANLARTLHDLQQKMPRIKSEDFVHAASSSLMMFAELAAERLRNEPHSHSINLTTVNLPSPIPKPQPQLQRTMGGFTALSPMPSPLSSRRYPLHRVDPSPSSSPFVLTAPISMAALHNIVLPTNPIWSPAAQLMRGSSSLSGAPPMPSPSTATQPRKSTPSTHTVSNILGVSNRLNIPSSPLDHKPTSAFQVVKKASNNIPKQPFGAVQNIPGRY